MPSVEWNKETWNNTHPWLNGDEWSTAWGGSSEAEWNFTLLPRIHRFLPTQTILEIAPGFGRWTQFLMNHCERLIGVDLSWKCVDACRDRFFADKKATFHVNDGYSLAMVDDESVDFAFSFDSLVHAEFDVVSAYLRELARVLKPEGAAFIHHSNASALEIGSNSSSAARANGRALSGSGELVLAECAGVGLAVASQERVNWNSDGLTDCMTVITRAPAQCAVVDNYNFMAEAANAAAISHLYVK